MSADDTIGPDNEDVSEVSFSVTQGQIDNLEIILEQIRAEVARFEELHANWEDRLKIAWARHAERSIHPVVGFIQMVLNRPESYGEDYGLEEALRESYGALARFARSLSPE